MQITQQIPPVNPRIPKTLEEMLKSTATAAGHSAVARYLTCPESVRLRSLMKLRRRGTQRMDARILGTLVHKLLELRVIHGMGVVWDLLGGLTPGSPKGEGIGLPYDMRAQLAGIMRGYDLTWPLETEPWKYLGLEAEVVSDLGGPMASGGALTSGTIQLPRSCRYDALVQYLPGHGRTDGVYALETKTSSRSGSGVVGQYQTQMAVQTAIWNRNPHLVRAHGPMLGVIVNAIVKTKVPGFERYGPFYMPRLAQDRVIEWMRLPTQVVYPLSADGSYPRMLQACWGKYSPCEYIGWCWEGATGDYELDEAALDEDEGET